VCVCVCICSRIKSIKSPASCAGKVSKPRLMSQAGRLPQSLPARVDQCVLAVRAIQVEVLVCLRSSCNHVTEVGGA
jgi:hypothetical protein